jgi:hypothetical protein
MVKVRRRAAAVAAIILAVFTRRSLRRNVVIRNV